jgi:CRP-like cAMP-binding protein
MFIADFMKAQISIAEEVLCMQGDLGDTLYILTEGSVSIF